MSEPTTLTIDLGETMWDTIAAIRDASPRLPLRDGDPADADTDEIVAALFPVIGQFLRAGAREHMANARADEDAVTGEEIPTIVRTTLLIKAQALTDLADQIDHEHKADTTAIYQLTDATGSVLSERADELDGEAGVVGVAGMPPAAHTVTCPVCGRPGRKLTKTGKLQPHSDPSKRTELPYGIRCKGVGKTLAELSR